MAFVQMYVSNRYNPDVRVQKEAASLVAAGYRVRVTALDREHTAARPFEVIEGVEVERVRCVKAPIGTVALTALCLAQFRERAVSRLRRDPPDAVHCHDQDTCAIGYHWQRFGSPALNNGVPGLFVFDAHDLYWTWLVMPDPGSLVRQGAAAFYKAVDAFYARAADLLVTTSSGTGAHPGFAEQYAAWGASPVVVWNAPREPETVPPFPARFTVGYVGSVRETAMFEWLLAAIERIPPADRPDLRIAGDGRCQRRVEEMLSGGARRLGIRCRVTGAFSLPELTAIIGETSIQYCVYPLGRGNMDRAMPVKLLDSAVHRRPAIGNADSLMGDWIAARGWGWTVGEGDVGSLARALSAAAAAHRDGTLATKLRGAPPGWDGEARKLIDAYDRLLGRAGV
jgi:glycosyltransferase involved in cell wall biosynthesis